MCSEDFSVDLFQSQDKVWLAAGVDTRTKVYEELLECQSFVMPRISRYGLNYPYVLTKPFEPITDCLGTYN